MRQMQPVLWTKGVLLSPQHLQTQDRFLEDLIQFQLSALTYCPWGFHRLVIDREALAGGNFAIASAAGLFPDGHNVSTSQRDQGTRFEAEMLLRRDENTGLSEKPIQVARKNFRILAEGESFEGSSVLRMARIRRLPTGDYQLDDRFVPPLIDIAASEYLLTIARRLVEILSARSSTLANTRRQRNQSLADFSISDVANFWLLYTVNTYFPQLRHLYETRRGHPAELYSTMLSLAGALSTFSSAVHPRALPGYEHDDLSRCFTELDERLRQLLETVVPVSSVSLPLQLVRPSIYATALDQEQYLAAPQLYLAVSGESKVADVVKKIPQLVKISSGDRIDHLVRQALPGVVLTHVPSPPSAVSVKVNCHYFALNRSGTEWDAIVRARNLAAFVPSDFRDPQLEL